MPESLNSATVTRKNQLHQPQPWIWLVELDVTTSGGALTGLRVCSGNADVTVSGLLYRAYPIALGVERRDVNGQLPQLELTVGNATRDIIAVLEAGNVLDRAMKIKAIFSDDTANVVDFGRFSVISARVSNATATLELGAYLTRDATIPARHWMRGRCPYLYAGQECAFNRSAALAWSGLAAFNAAHSGFSASTCDLTLDGSNGCTVHGQLESSMGLYSAHPRRYGGTPSIPRGPARV